MAPKDEEDWSDSDEEVGSDDETAVQLGIPDGSIESPADLCDPMISRIGGHPTFLAAPEPPIEYALCGNCAQPMQLLVQVWCPLEQSSNDRVLYVWACPRGPCQKKDGSVRAWRSLRHNKKYAEKLAQKLAMQKAKEEAETKAAEKAARKSVPKANPFSMKSAGLSNPFDLGAQVFGGGAAASTEPPARAASSEADASSSSGEESDEHDEEDLATRMASATLDGSNWASLPAYEPLYLSTISEYLPPVKKVKVPAGEEYVEEDDGKKSKDTSWALEGYENSIEVDHAFERFTKRVGYEGEQCLRYELGGIPLPFSSDSVFDRLFPKPSAPPPPVTKSAFMVVPAQKRIYNASVLAHCRHCHAPRVFECQLMPNLINVLKTPAAGGATPQQSDEERRQEVLRVLKGERVADRVGMEWGTCMVFSCEKDCAEDGAPVSWREELVEVQWDD